MITMIITNFTIIVITTIIIITTIITITIIKRKTQLALSHPYLKSLNRKKNEQ